MAKRTTTPSPARSGMRQMTAAIVLSLFLGGASIVAAYFFQSRFGAPALYLQLVAHAEGGARGVILRFKNIGADEMALDIANLDVILRPPLNKTEPYVIHARNAPSGKPAVLRPGEIAQVLVPLPAMPAGEILMAAAYESRAAAGKGSGIWQGLVRSFPIKLAATG